jgi:hypothetical protein
LSVFCSSKQLRKQDVNVLFINQLSLDLFAVSGSLLNIQLKWQTFIWKDRPVIGCVHIHLKRRHLVFWHFRIEMNLMSIAIERYVKIVHPIWHKNNFKSWMIYSAAVVPWAVGVFLSQCMASWSTTVVDGQCLWGFLDKRLGQIRSHNLDIHHNFLSPARILLVLLQQHHLTSFTVRPRSLLRNASSTRSPRPPTTNTTRACR